MGSLNRVQLLGNMGAEAKVQQLQNGNKYAMFSLATSEPAVTLQNGTQVPERTEWHTVVAWGRQADVVQQYLPKGAQVYVEGKLRTRKYTKDGVEKYTTEVIAENIILLRGNSRMQPNAGNGSYNVQMAQGGTSYQGMAQNATQSPTEGKKDDDLPF
jgi:single-strand DNA-binding protein